MLETQMKLQKVHLKLTLLYNHITGISPGFGILCCQRMVFLRFNNISEVLIYV